MEDFYSINEEYVKDVVGSSPLVCYEERSSFGTDSVESPLKPHHRENESNEKNTIGPNDDDDNHYGSLKDVDESKFFLPDVPNDCTPKIGDFFINHIDAERCYRSYAEKAGFDVRLSNKKIGSEGRITTRYFVCSKQGIPTPKIYDSLDFRSGSRKRRNTNLKRTGCQACFRVHFVKERNRYEVYKFVEWHNHILFSEHEMAFSRSSRTLSYAEQKNVFHSCAHKVGVSKGHRIRNALIGGAGNSGVTVRDYQNYRRDMNTFVGNKDAQMLINTMTSRQQICPEYFFEYKVDGKELFAIFWADETARMNYREFGDVISFDATFRTNMHAMSFVPFVGVDNHKKIVVIGAALISGETAEHYSWVLKAFLKAHGRPPVFVITDQCLAMKKAIPEVFPESRHRLCMWHITNKVDDKISVYLKCKTSFKAEFNKLVWDVNMTPSVFEASWNALMEKYSLVGDSWFEEMFNIREHWIPAYFKDFSMSGLMKTTSRSESINAFFNVFHAFHHDLMLFLHSFDNAIDKQRKVHAADEVKMKSTVPRMVSLSKIEEHAAVVFSRTYFFEFQEEFSQAMNACTWGGFVIVGGTKVYTITEEIEGYDEDTNFTVVRDFTLDTIECSCNFFVRNGILCRHVLKVLVNEKVKTIPDKYFLRRWKCDLIPVQWLPAKVRYGEVDAEVQKLMGDAHKFVEGVLERLKNDKDALSEYVSVLQKWYSDVPVDENQLSGRERRISNIQEFMGAANVDNVEVYPPTGVRNKGCGTGKRLIGIREKVAKKMKKLKKQKRVCKNCGQKALHDSRNCPDK